MHNVPQHHIPQHLSRPARELLRGLSQTPYPKDRLLGWREVRQQVARDAVHVQELLRRSGVEIQSRPETVAGVPCVWIEPVAEPSAESLLLYTHGGGYISGSAETFLGLPFHVALASGMRVLSIDYRLAPEHPFPAALDDALAVYRRLLDDGWAAHRLGWFGDSAGGGLALGVGHALKRLNLPLPGAYAPLSPWADLTMSGDSWYTLEHADLFFTRSALEAWGTLYASGQYTEDPRLSPIYGSFEGFPPLLIQAGTKEVMLSDALQLARQARRDGIEVTLDVWDGMWHAFQATPGLPEAQEAIDGIGRFFRRHLA